MGCETKSAMPKKWFKIDQFESRFGAHKQAGSGSTDLPHFGARMLKKLLKLEVNRKVTWELGS